MISTLTLDELARLEQEVSTYREWLLARACARELFGPRVARFEFGLDAVYNDETWDDTVDPDAIRAWDADGVALEHDTTTAFWSAMLDQYVIDDVDNIPEDFAYEIVDHIESYLDVERAVGSYDFTKTPPTTFRVLGPYEENPS